jgi:intraflagellar transport protein 20
MAGNKLITFDDEFRLRVLDADKHEASRALRDSCLLFGASIEQLQEMSKKYVKALETAAKCIEAEKLRAVGLRNKVAAAREERTIQQNALQLLKSEKQKALDSLIEEEMSLKLIVDDQDAQIARLQGMATV